jgi:hypothetical protein
MLRLLVIRLCVVLFACAACAGTALAQLRTIPADAKRGEMRSKGNMDVEISGKAMQLSPGAQIRDANNMIVLPTAIPSGAKVKYQLDPQNFVHRVWILTPQEEAQPDVK